MSTCGIKRINVCFRSTFDLFPAQLWAEFAAERTRADGVWRQPMSFPGPPVGDACSTYSIPQPPPPPLSRPEPPFCHHFLRHVAVQHGRALAPTLSQPPFPRRPELSNSGHLILAHLAVGFEADPAGFELTRLPEAAPCHGPAGHRAE